MKNCKSLLCILALPVLTACGDSSSQSSDPVSINKTGVFLDSQVVSIGYRTETLEGVTNSQGEFEFLPGETVTFFIGDLELPTTTASSVVTPADISSGDSVLQTNILQLLQTLDSDGDVENGITIFDDAANAFIGMEFDLSSETFDAEIVAVLDNIESGLALVNESTANAHFEASQQLQILGSWYYQGDDLNVLTFIDNQRYIIIHDGGGTVEYGNYSWNANNNDFTVSLIGESDGEGGLYDEESNVTSLAMKNNTFILHTNDNWPVGVDYTFTKIDSYSNPLIGGWIYEDNVLVFLSESQYTIAHWNNLDGQTLSGEFGRYDLNGDIFVVSSVSSDSDGVAGLYNAVDPSDQEGETLTIDQSTITITNPNEGSFSFERIGS